MVHPICLLAVYYVPGNKEWIHHSPTGAREREHTFFTRCGIYELTGSAEGHSWWPQGDLKTPRHASLLVGTQSQVSVTPSSNLAQIASQSAQGVASISPQESRLDRGQVEGGPGWCGVGQRAIKTTWGGA